MNINLVLTAACAVLSFHVGAAVESTATPPPNAPSEVKWDAATGKLTLNYHGGVILDATVRAEDAAGKPMPGATVKLGPAPAGTAKDKVEQRTKFALTANKQGVELVLRGTVTRSAGAFPAETEAAAQKRLPLIRNSVGLSRSLRNNAVYDRRWDWLLAGPPDGAILQHSGFYALNTHNKEAVDAMIRPLYRGLKEQGWSYVKVDGAGDLMSAYNRKDVTRFFEQVHSTPAETWRVWDEVAREELGPDIFLLTCWGVGPGVNSVGLANACRLSSDGFGTGEFQHFNSWNGVVWRNDPDHCDVLGQYYMDNDAMMPVFAIREARAHPWLLSTTRHISQGGVDVLDETWNKATGTLAGKSKEVNGDPYVLMVHVPSGFKLKTAEVAGEKPWNSPMSNFMYAGKMTAIIGMGIVASKLGVGKRLTFSTAAMKFANEEANKLMGRKPRDGWDKAYRI